MNRTIQIHLILFNFYPMMITLLPKLIKKAKKS